MVHQSPPRCLSRRQREQREELALSHGVRPSWIWASACPGPQGFPGNTWRVESRWQRVTTPTTPSNALGWLEKLRPSMPVADEKESPRMSRWGFFGPGLKKPRSPKDDPFWFFLVKCWGGWKKCLQPFIFNMLFRLFLRFCMEVSVPHEPLKRQFPSNFWHSAFMNLKSCILGRKSLHILDVLCISMNCWDICINPLVYICFLLVFEQNSSGWENPLQWPWHLFSALLLDPGATRWFEPSAWQSERRSFFLGFNSTFSTFSWTFWLAFESFYRVFFSTCRVA